MSIHEGLKGHKNIFLDPYPLIDNVLREDAKSVKCLRLSSGSNGFHVTRDDCWEEVAHWIVETLSSLPLNGTLVVVVDYLDGFSMNTILAYNFQAVKLAIKNYIHD